MYTTFAANSSRQTKGPAVTTFASTANKVSKPNERILADDSPIGTTSAPPEARRTKRAQVARACESCRINRIKCDDRQPCNACRNRGEECSNSGRPGLLTLPAANKEIDRLEAHIKQLENELQDSRQLRATSSNSKSTPSPEQASACPNVDLVEDHGEGHRPCQGNWITTPPSSEPQLSSPSSRLSFADALQSFISSSLQLPQPDFQIHPSGASRFRASPTVSRRGSNDFSLMSDSESQIQLTRNQEGYFLALFWQSYHCMMPILNEGEFRESYESLWSSNPPSSSRKASPLVDIMLALCMQYGLALVPRNEERQPPISDFDTEDPSIAGRSLYRRCQTLLSSTIETPSTLTLQCQIFSAIYLRNASFLNMSHNMLASALRTAQTLGLHRDFRASSSRNQRDLHRRMWWVLYILESLACMDLGRPWLTQLSQVQCAPSSDDQELATLSGPSFVLKAEGITWLSFHKQHLKLVLAARAVYTASEGRVEQVLRTGNHEIFQGNAQSLEEMADFLISSIACLRTWIQDVPDGLKVERKEGGKAFSTDRSIMQLDLEAPQWLLRQQLLLELTYHHLMMNLYRPFINFKQMQSLSIPLCNSNSISSLNHAIAITNIVSQVLKSTDILNGWYEAYQIQWNATLTLVGFIFANPVCPPTPTARRTLNSAIEVFVSFRSCFSTAASAIIIARDLAAKIDIFLDHFRAGSTSASDTPLLAPKTVNRNFDKAAATGVVRDFDINSHNQNPTSSNIPQAAPDGDITMSHFLFSEVMNDSFSTDPFSGAEWSFSNETALTTDMWP